MLKVVKSFLCPVSVRINHKSITAKMCLPDIVDFVLLIVAAPSEGGAYDLNTVFTLRCLPWHWCVCRPRGGL